MVNRTLAGLPFAIALKRDAGAVDAKVQRAMGAPVGDLDSKCLLSPAQGGMIRHGALQLCHRQRAGSITLACLMVRQNGIATSANAAG